MNRSTHRAIGSWVFGTLLLGFLVAVFWLSSDTLPPFKLQVLGFVMALVAGLFGFFLTGSLSLSMKHKESSTTLNAVGGIALFVIILAWWNSSLAPISKVTANQSNPTATTASEVDTTVKQKAQPSTKPMTSSDSSLNVKGDATIKVSGEGKQVIQTGNGQIQQGSKVSGTVKEAPATTGNQNSSINIDGNLNLETSDKGSVTIQTGDGQIQQTQ